MQYVMAAGIPAVPMLLALVAGIAKDGSPLRRSWWSS